MTRATTCYAIRNGRPWGGFETARVAMMKWILSPFGPDFVLATCWACVCTHMHIYDAHRISTDYTSTSIIGNVMRCPLIMYAPVISKKAMKRKQ